MPDLHVLSAGAAKGLVQGVQAEFERDTGFALQGTFGAVGAMLERLNGGAPCDVIILTRTMIDALAHEGRLDVSREGRLDVSREGRLDVSREGRLDVSHEGRLDPPRIADLGWVHTGVAVTEGALAGAVTDVPSLLAVLQPAHAIYLPDPERATAGIHALRVLKALGLRDLEARLRAFPNGAEAMAALAQQGNPQAVGITQVSEIRYTPGVKLLGVLPAPHGLATRYSGAVVRGARQADGAAQLLQRLTAPERAHWRVQAGFEPAAA